MGKGLDNFLNRFSEDRDELGGSGRCGEKWRAARPAAGRSAATADAGRARGRSSMPLIHARPSMI